MRQRWTLPRLAICAAAIIAAPTVASAQTTGPTPPQRPLLLLDAGYGIPQRVAIGASILVPIGKPFSVDGGSSGMRQGVELGANGGKGAFRAVAGVGRYLSEGPGMTVGGDLLFTIARTTKTPRTASPSSTYVGTEVGFLVTAVRVSAGVAHRVAGADVGKATLFTWSVGVQVPLGW